MDNRSTLIQREKAPGARELDRTIGSNQAGMALHLNSRENNGNMRLIRRWDE